MRMQNTNKRSAHAGAEKYTANMEATVKYEFMVEALPAFLVHIFPAKASEFVAFSVNSDISIANHSLTLYRPGIVT